MHKILSRLSENKPLMAAHTGIAVVQHTAQQQHTEVLRPEVAVDWTDKAVAFAVVPCSGALQDGRLSAWDDYFRVTIGDMSIVVWTAEGLSVSVAFPSGHQISKSILRTIRRAVEASGAVATTDLSSRQGVQGKEVEG